MTRSVAAVLAVAALLAPIGCGGETGVAGDAAVTVYADAPLCAGAERELTAAGGEAGSFRVELACLPASRRSGRLDLAAVGANARRATEDSTAIAYLGVPDPAASRFSVPILDAAGIARLSGASGAAAMSRLLQVVAGAEEGARLREAVSDGAG